MLPTEHIVRPSPQSPANVFSLAYSAQLLGAFGLKELIRALALHLSETPSSVSCSVWLEEGPALIHLYLAFPTDCAYQDLFDRITHGLMYEDAVTTCELPESANPVLRLHQGEVSRLWPAPGPKVAVKQKMSVDWGTFTITNKVFEIV